MNVRMIMFMLAFVSPASIFSQSDKGFVRDGNKDYRNEKFSEAEINYRKALDKNPQKLSAQYNLGNALYKQENFEKAAETYASTNLSNANDIERSNASYNLGNAFLKANKLQESIQAYKQSLKYNPNNENARYNLEYARQKMQQQDQNQNQQDQDQQQNEDQQQDQQQQDQQQQDQTTRSATERSAAAATTATTTAATASSKYQ
jgi:Ca-activated chloride channel family protein